MTKTNKLLLLLAIGFMTCASLEAQDADFDLSAQRSEMQNIPKIPGKVINHHGITINPTPHDLIVKENKRVDISQGLAVKDKQQKFSGNLKFITENKKGLKLTIDFGAKIAAKSQVKAVSGAYILNIDEKKISIVGYDERGVFYGIQTLHQIMENSDSDKSLPCLTVNDYPDLALRGVVEGFYGTPWSHQVRLSLIDFYGKFKMNTYIYGPKDDPYHSCPNWRLPYPKQEADNIKELVEACNRNHVDFVWAIHPGQDIKWNEEDFKNLVGKFDMMYNLGVRSFAIFFDDISGEGTNPEKQVDLLNRLTTEFVKAKKDVNPLIICPTDYSKLWANPTPQGSLSIYGQKLDPSVKVFWTGDVVCSDLTKATLDWVNSRIQRPAFFWWNYPVTDYVRNIILQGPVYGLDTSLTDKDICAFVSNPMEHGEASKLALYGVADYTWNIASYNPMDNWERAFTEISPEVKDAYHTFAIHSGDTETGYRRDESWNIETFPFNKYTTEQYNDLYSEFTKITGVPETMEKCKNKALLAELNPWLTEFGKLGNRGIKALELIKIYETGNSKDFWSAYVNNLMTSKDKNDYMEHKSGTMKLQPFYESTMNDLAATFYNKLTGKAANIHKAIGTYNNLKIQGKLMLDNDSTTFYTSGNAQKSGDWIGIDMGHQQEIYGVSILQGRKSDGDSDYFDHAILEYSTDGKTWIPITEELQKQYQISWEGSPVQARYVRLKRLDSAKTNWASVRSFEINPLKAERLGFRIEAADADKALFAFDGNPLTSYNNNDRFSFEVAKNIKNYTLLLKLNEENTPVTLRQFNAKGKLLCEDTLTTPLFNMTVAKGTAKVEISGKAEVFEIIPE